ncbi:ABC transporter permease [Bacillus sp. JCM 19034]|uniref:ABC transporter permease n=1 Tax=Bacillus sp. JCM 19034 TaxID=1481928 RepID=UPI0007818E2A|nr:hypothetical protein [Bacillus sp. JCM 19034]
MTVFHHLWMMVGFIIRQDRIRLSIWIFSFVIVTIATASAFTNLYSSAEERQAMVQTVDNPAMTAMLGPGYGLDNYTEAAMMAHQMLLLTAVLVALMNILLTNRHTRSPEEDGRMEMLRALPFGKLTQLSATIIVMTGANAIIALATGFGLYSLGIESMDLHGSIMYGAVLGGVGLLFATVTAVFAQLSESARGTLGLSFAILGLAYLVRAVGDVSNETLSWFSPLGWAVRTEAYVSNKWGPLFLLVALAVLLFALALYLQFIRDLGSGFLPTRAGRKEASVFLKGPFSLALRLQRTALISWFVAMILLGISYGSVLGDLESFFASNELMAEMFASEAGFSMTEQFIAMIMMVMAITAAIPALLVMFKLKAEERKYRNEHVLARAVSRNHQFASYAILALVVSVIMILAAGMSLGIAGTAVMDDPLPFSHLVGAAFAYIPVLSVIVGLGALFVGLFPKATAVTWLYLGFSFVTNYFGALFQFPDWLVLLTPFGHVSQFPMEELNYAATFVLLLVAAGMFVVAFLGFNKRDIQG